MRSDAESKELTLCALGDVLPNRSEPGKMLELCADRLKGFDIRTCQLETSLSERGTRNYASPGKCRSHPQNIDALKAGGINVVTFASNHTLDWGVQAMDDTIEILRKNGIKVIGVGSNLDEAQRPLILEVKGTKVAFLDYCSILPEGFWATDERPGVAALRVKTFYELMEPEQPGGPPRIFTYPNEQDFNTMQENIRRAKAAADVVVLALHWGLHFQRAKLATYQRPVAHAAIDAGADIIIGHHPHILKGIEVYKGKVIFYSLGNFALDSAFRSWPNLNPWQRELVETYGLVVDPACTNPHPYAPDSKKTMAAKCVIAEKKIKKVSFLPAMIGIDARPRILPHENPEFNEVVSYMIEITGEAGLNASYDVDGDEVVISDKP